MDNQTIQEYETALSEIQTASEKLPKEWQNVFKLAIEVTKSKIDDVRRGMS